MTNILHCIAVVCARPDFANTLRKQIDSGQMILHIVTPLDVATLHQLASRPLPLTVILVDEPTIGSQLRHLLSMIHDIDIKEILAVVEHGDVAAAVEFIKLGANDVYQLPDAAVLIADHLHAHYDVEFSSPERVIDSLYFHIDMPEEGIDMAETMELLEDQLLLQALFKTSGNKAQAARLLGLNRTTFLEKLKRRHITHEPSN